MVKRKEQRILLYPGDWIRFADWDGIRIGRIEEITAEGRIWISRVTSRGWERTTVELDSVLKKYPKFMVWPIPGERGK